MQHVRSKSNFRLFRSNSLKGDSRGHNTADVCCASLNARCGCSCGKCSTRFETRLRRCHIDTEFAKNVLSADEWSRVDAAVERAFSWLATQQRNDGAFSTQPTGQPGVTSLCTLA